MIITEKKLFDIAIKKLSETSGAEVARQLHVSGAAVSKMKNGDPAMITLAIRYLEQNGYEISRDESGNIARFFKISTKE